MMLVMMLVMMIVKNLLKIVTGAFAPRWLRVMAGTMGVNLLQPTNGYCRWAKGASQIGQRM